MRKRRFENTIREQEDESRGARRCPLGSSTHVLPFCLRARVPAGPAGERPPPVGPGPLGVREGARDRCPLVRGQESRAGWGQSASPGGRVVALRQSRAWVRRWAARGRGGPRAFEAFQGTGRVRAVSGLGDF